MGTLFGFAVGYILGARAGESGYDEVVRSVRAIRQSEEFRGFVSAMKDHGRHILREVSGRLAGDEDQFAMANDDFGNGLGLGEDHRPKMPF
jgi:hypothetical protein